MQANLIWLITVGQRRQVLHRVSTEKPLIRPVPEVNGKLSSLAVKLSIWVPILQGLFIPAPACLLLATQVVPLSSLLHHLEPSAIREFRDLLTPHPSPR